MVNKPADNIPPAFPPPSPTKRSMWAKVRKHSSWLQQRKTSRQHKTQVAESPDIHAARDPPPMEQPNRATQDSAAQEALVREESEHRGYFLLPSFSPQEQEQEQGKEVPLGEEEEEEEKEEEAEKNSAPGQREENIFNSLSVSAETGSALEDIGTLEQQVLALTKHEKFFESGDSNFQQTSLVESSSGSRLYSKSFTNLGEASERKDSRDDVEATNRIREIDKMATNLITEINVLASKTSLSAASIVKSMDAETEESQIVEGQESREQEVEMLLKESAAKHPKVMKKVDHLYRAFKKKTKEATAERVLTKKSTPYEIKEKSLDEEEDPEESTDEEQVEDRFSLSSGDFESSVLSELPMEEVPPIGCCFSILPSFLTRWMLGGACTCGGEVPNEFGSRRSFSSPLSLEDDDATSSSSSHDTLPTTLADEDILDVWEKGCCDRVCGT